MKHFKHTLPLTLALVAIGLVSFGATALAAGAVAPSSGSLLDLAKPVYEAISSGHYIACAALALILAMALVRRYAPKYLGATVAKFVNSDAGNAISTLVVSFLGAVATGTAAGVHWGGLSTHLLWTSLLVGVTAVGGYEVLLHLLAGPVLAKIETKLPAWMQPIVGLLLGVFNKDSGNAQALAKAQAAGQAAVAANPAPGVAGVIGKPTEIK